MRQERRVRFVLIVEDHPLVSDSLAACVREHDPMMEIEGADSLQAALRVLESRAAPALIITDLELTDSQGIEVARTLRERAPQSALLVVTASDNAAYRQLAGELGAIGYVVKSSATQLLRKAIGMALGEPSGAHRIARKPANDLGRLLTPRQLLVLEHAAAGRSNKEIALKLQIGDETVGSHMKEIFGRLEVRNRTEAVVRYLQLRKERPAR